MGIKDNIQVPFFPEMNGGRDTMNNFLDSIYFTFSSGNGRRNEKIHLQDKPGVRVYNSLKLISVNCNT